MSLLQAVKAAGSQAKLGKICGISQPGVKKWLDKNSLPYTEWTGKTNYGYLIYKKLGVVVDPFDPQETKKSA